MYGDNLPPGCTVADIERAAGGDEDEHTRPILDYDPSDAPGMDPETWDDRDGVAAERSVSVAAMNAMRRMMGLALLPTPSA
jgi:hypothetical protein